MKETITKHFSRKALKLSLLTLLIPFSLLTLPSSWQASHLNDGITSTVQADQVSGKHANAYLQEALDWTFEANPNYYKVLGESDINPADFPEVGKIVYSNLDELGRTQTAKGTLTYQNVAASYNIRQKFGPNENPSGWTGNAKNKKYRIDWLNGLSYQGDFWNRSHLIADSLGGDALRVNAITGTRTQNVGGRDQRGGMRYTEQKAQTWLENNQDGQLYYEASPIYNGDELLPRAVLVSVLSSDNTINEKVLVYNTANGYTINYLNGTFTKNN
ncbi:DNA/RNA non-specific endonuclease [Streptococcus didelphis]|uniref:DNA/RNA non-specific endonuclease n=1 Tax=Streptococcus didelphis TaxID=102886 RepID=UPI00037513F7|nr:DNA/RNA non-specific endonuclease [Streptococcus didelphis]